MKIVAPFRPFPLEAPHHIEVAGNGFDWIDAIRMMSASASWACNCSVYVLTDVDTDLPFPTYKYRTEQRRLMLWYLEICARYLESADFDDDTVMLDSDQLVYGDLSVWFHPYVDLGICIREPKAGVGFPILNGVQFWSRRAPKGALAAFYWRALAIAQSLPEHDIVWGADTEALRILLEPLSIGRYERCNLWVRLIDSDYIIEALRGVHLKQLKAGKAITPPLAPVLDFRNLRKPYMRAIFERTMHPKVLA